MIHRESLPEQVAAELRSYIAQEMRPGDKLPSEQDLAVQVGVSRNTLREALLQLWNSGVLIRRWGVGTFVADITDPVGISGTLITPLRDVLRSAGHEPALSFVNIVKAEASAEVAAALAVKLGTMVWRIDRIFDVEDTPAVYLQDFVPIEIDGSTWDPNPLVDVNIDIIRLLATTAGCDITRMEIELEAVAVTDDLAAHMMLPLGSPVVRAVQASYTDRGAIVIFSEIYYRTDVARFRFSRAAEPQGSAFPQIHSPRYRPSAQGVSSQKSTQNNADLRRT